jgi:NADPH-dependent glutamate synthase beta subunit-like oxidoreductase
LGTNDEQLAGKAIDIYRKRYSTIGLFENEVYEGIHELLKSLKEDGFSAAFMTVGSKVPKLIPVKGEDSTNVQDCMTFLKGARAGKNAADVEGKHVVVLGGGDVAIDVARSAIRMNPASVSIVCRKPRDHMRATEYEVIDAEDEGVIIHAGTANDKVFIDENGIPSHQNWKDVPFEVEKKD